ncbi:MAG: hypothetical protein HZA24_05210 [Nitrospirae bacterium]|nr:hypothetical protein [Nitrospirota bacterium]
MMPVKWIPLKFIIRRVAQAHGFLDPIALLARLQRFTQPSEVGEPIELLRAGVVLHARGLINSRVIQHNLDWVWPYWVERQFDPEDISFVPRAFSITHINLTHRNWTAVGLPDCDHLPIVDPRGLLTPLFDEWSLDAWVMGAEGRVLLPSRAPDARQELAWDAAGPWVATTTAQDGMHLTTRARVLASGGRPMCRWEVSGGAPGGGWLAVALRPYNPEGISFVHQVALNAARNGWTVNGNQHVHFSERVARHHVSDYRSGDVHIHLRDREDQDAGHCDVGMVTAAALFALPEGGARQIRVEVPLGSVTESGGPCWVSWPDALAGHAPLDVPDPHIRFLYDAAIRTLVLHSPGDVYPGSYTYKRFWFRDAAFIAWALLCAGLTERARRALERFPGRQTSLGFFHSQDGEWDANGEALWIMERYCRMTGQAPPAHWSKAILNGARWITRKRLSGVHGVPHAGLLPAGFSAEHLGPNDYYYWDDFWGVAGLRAAAAMADGLGHGDEAALFRRDADMFWADLVTSLDGAARRLGRPAMPASPYRRLDAGMIGSVVAGYPLQLFAPDDPRLLDGVAYLREHCFFRGGFFQDMTHSGVNAYLTLHVAQVLLRAGDPAFWDIVRAVADLASPTGQWPEAVHPRTGGGCMGDGQHVWAAAEWVAMLRNCFVREEGDGLVLGGGVPAAWLAGTEPVGFGPAPTAFGPVRVTLTPRPGALEVAWEGRWHGAPPAMSVRLPGHAPVVADPAAGRVVLPA